MKLTDTGESRIRGYLFVLGRSLRTFLPAAVADDAVREVESHIRERIEQIDRREAPRSRAEAAVRLHAAKADERTMVEQVLGELGPPLRVAQAYSREMTLDEAVATGRFVPMLRALWHVATTSVAGFTWAILALLGWTLGLAFFAIALLKPIFPGNVGFIVNDGAVGPGLHVMTVPRFSLDVISSQRSFSFGAQFPLHVGSHVYGGYWVIPLAIVLGLVVLVLTYRSSRRMLAWLRSRQAAGGLRVRLVVEPN